MHLVIYFSGTGDSGEAFYGGLGYLHNENIVTIFVKGCEQPEVCNSYIFPDLNKFAKRFVAKLFPQNKEVNFPDLESVGVDIEHCQNILYIITNHLLIESITLSGYSRGAATCFEVAKELNKIASHIPVNIIADQPVTGNSYQGPGTNAASIADCSDLTNLRGASIILGTYTGKIYKENIQGNISIKNPIHRLFFSQIVPVLPGNVSRNLILIPCENHNAVLVNSPGGSQYMHLEIARCLNQQDKSLVTDKQVNKITEFVKDTYQQEKDLSNKPAFFPQTSEIQKIFGLIKEEAYQYLDKLHPAYMLRAGFIWEEDETLIDWWNKHDKKNLKFPSKLTMNLFYRIKHTDPFQKKMTKNYWKP